MTDCVGGSTQNVFFPKNIKVCAKSVSKIIAPPKEMLLSFLIGTFKTNYDVIRIKRNIYSYTPLTKNEQK